MINMTFVLRSLESIAMVTNSFLGTSAKIYIFGLYSLQRRSITDWKITKIDGCVNDGGSSIPDKNLVSFSPASPGFTRLDGVQQSSIISRGYIVS